MGDSSTKVRDGQRRVASCKINRHVGHGKLLVRIQQSLDIVVFRQDVVRAEKTVAHPPIVAIEIVLKVYLRYAKLVNSEALQIYCVVRDLLKAKLYFFATVRGQIYALLHPLWSAATTTCTRVAITPIASIRVTRGCIAPFQGCPVLAIRRGFDEGIIIIFFQVVPGGELQRCPPPMQSRQINGAGQRAIHIVIAIAPPLIDSSKGVITN